VKLRKLFINNFRGIDSLEVRFDAAQRPDSQQLVVLAGPNACGKTSVLEAILICLGRADLLPRRSDPKHNVMKTATGFSLES
jgi:predicted ATP-dependent endonuclease of OLD family